MTPKNLVQRVSLAILFLTCSAQAWDPADLKKKIENADEAKAELLSTDPSMQRFFDSASGSVIIPTAEMGAVGTDGARGVGLLYETGKPTYEVTLSQLTIGFQWGEQVYSELIFLKDENALNHFKRGNFESGAQASAVAVKTGASEDANYSKRGRYSHVGQRWLDLRDICRRTEIQSTRSGLAFRRIAFGRP